MKEKILVALSDSTLAQHLSETLKNEGYVPVMAATGPEALEKMRKEMPDAAVIDLVLKDKSGYDVLAEKTLDRFITKIPTIVVSNSGGVIEMRRIPSTPSIRDYVIRSHVEPREILQKVAAVFGRIHNSPAAVVATSPKKGSSTPLRILWVEDDKFLCSLIIKKFTAVGHTVLMAQNSSEAYAVLDKEIPDIIILDILLPGESGFVILQKIKMDPRTRNVPVIMFSNFSNDGEIEKARQLGARKYLVKAAVSLDDMVKEIEQMSKS